MNQKSGSNIFLVSTHSACRYKNYGLGCFPEPQTLFIYLVFSFFQGTATLSIKIVQKLSISVRYTLYSHPVQLSIFGKGSSFTYACAANIANEWFPIQTYGRYTCCIIYKLKVKIKNLAPSISSFDPFCVHI